MKTDVKAELSSSKEVSVTRSWIEQETLADGFKDKRLSKRFHKVLSQLFGANAQSIPWACQDWANAKAAYRFFDNEQVDSGQILAGHFRATSERFAQTSSIALVLHDTTEFSYQRENVGLIAQTPACAPCAVASGTPLMWAIHALQSCGDPIGLATGVGIGEILDAQKVQGSQCAQAQD